MPSFPYLDGAGNSRNRNTTKGDGSLLNPDVAEFGVAPSYGSATLNVNTTLTPQILINVELFTRVAIQLDNAGVNLNGLEISTNHHTTGTHTVRLNTASHYTSPNSGSILRASSNFVGAVTNFTTLATGTGGVLIFDLRDFRCTELRIRATVASGISILSVLWSGIY